VQFSPALEREYHIGSASILFTSPNAKYYYGLCILGWTIGIISARGRVRVLVATGAAAFGFYLLYTFGFVLLDVNWWLPLPFYVEHCLAYLFMPSAIAGYWSALQAICLPARAASVRTPFWDAIFWRADRGIAADTLARIDRCYSRSDCRNAVCIRTFEMRPGRCIYQALATAA
jgi:hypothetical protein